MVCDTTECLANPSSVKNLRLLIRDESRYHFDPRENAKSYFDSQRESTSIKQKATILLQSVKRAGAKPETRFPSIHAYSLQAYGRLLCKANDQTTNL